MAKAKHSEAALAVVEAWDKEICQKRDILDPDDQLCWESLFWGFAIGKGLPLSEIENGLYRLALRKEVGE